MAVGWKPAISVVIPAYNREKVIGRAVESVLSQTMADFELIVVDDGSTDATAETVQAFEDRRVRLISQPNRGRSAARNRGVLASCGTCVTFLDSDDWALPTWLERLSQALGQPGVSLACCGVRVIKDRDQVLRETFVKLPENGGPIYRGQDCLFLAGSFAVARELFDRVGGYHEALSFSENTDLGLRLVRQCLGQGDRMVAVLEPLIVFQNTRPLKLDRAGARGRLESAECMLRLHGKEYFKCCRTAYANYRAIAGANAARLGLYGRGAVHFLWAILACPFQRKNYGRLLLLLVPGLRDQIWRTLD